MPALPDLASSDPVSARAKFSHMAAHRYIVSKHAAVRSPNRRGMGLQRKRAPLLLPCSDTRTVHLLLRHAGGRCYRCRPPRLAFAPVHLFLHSRIGARTLRDGLAPQRSPTPRHFSRCGANLRRAADSAMIPTGPLTREPTDKTTRDSLLRGCSCRKRCVP